MSDNLLERLRNGWDEYDVPMRATDAMSEAAARIEALTAQLESTLRDRKVILEERDRTFALMLRRAEKAEAERDRLPAAQPKVKPLVWVDADEGMCTKWRAAALQGRYELVTFKGEEGWAVNFCWGRPLSFWFIQGDPDEWGPTGPKMFPTLEAAKAAALADHEARISASLEPDAREAARLGVVKITVSRRLAREVLQWIEDEIAIWPDGTAYQRDLQDARAALAGEIATEVAA